MEDTIFNLKLTPAEQALVLAHLAKLEAERLEAERIASQQPYRRPTSWLDTGPARFARAMAQATAGGPGACF